MTKRKPAAGASAPAASTETRPAEAVATGGQEAATGADGDTEPAENPDAPSRQQEAPGNVNDLDEGLALDGKTLRVRSVSQAGRRRAGMAFGPSPIELTPDDVSLETIAELLADPQLVVELV